MNILLTLLARLLAAILSMFAHRAGLCSVVAVKELLERQRPDMLCSFFKAVLWVMAVMIAVTWIAPDIVKTPATWHISISGIIGGLIFGVGAAVNRGCALSTLRELCNGRFAILGTFAGLYLGLILPRFFTGGLLMGIGAASIPGGNDVLLLHGIPGFSFHAVPVFLAMLAGIALTLLVARRVVRNRQAG